VLENIASHLVDSGFRDSVEGLGGSHVSSHRDSSCRVGKGGEASRHEACEGWRIFHDGLF
jgi:hypothetical protein